MPVASLSRSRFADLARGKSVVTQESILPDTNSPGVSVNRLFPLQSYFSSTLYETAILQQTINEPIVGSTLKKEQIGGYSVGLHPSSQTPIAFRPLVGGSAAAAQAIILRPGQIYRPHGKNEGRPGNFSAFEWGLPFGWLGGGLATLYVFPSADADVAWPGDAEVIFQRQRMPIFQSGTLPANAQFNWPLRFPWPHAFRSTVNQNGTPIVSISEPTRILMSLRLPSLTNPATMRFLIQASNDMDLDSAGAPVITPVRYVEYIWGSYSAGVGAGNLSVNYPVVELTGEMVRLAADDGGVCLVETSAGAQLAGAEVDIVRFGKI